jgi:hypothetical protein
VKRVLGVNVGVGPTGEYFDLRVWKVRLLGHSDVAAAYLNDSTCRIQTRKLRASKLRNIYVDGEGTHEKQGTVNTCDGNTRGPDRCPRN